MHQTSGRWQYGLFLTALTVLMWGVLPLVLKILLKTMDAYTITWYRFVAASLVIGFYLAARNQLPVLRGLSRAVWVLLIVAVTGLAGNYVLYLVGLDLITPGTAQIVIQLAPVMLMLGALVVFRETFSRRQWFGFVVLLIGLALFFSRRLVELFTQAGDFSAGVFLIFFASITWAAYALAQKQLLLNFKSVQIMFLIYLASVFLFFPASHPETIVDIDGTAIALLAFASINTLIAYGAFAEALNHWQASRVSAVLAITPLLTLLSVEILHHFRPGVIDSENLAIPAIIGALLVVFGSMLTSLGRNSRAKAPGTSKQPPAAQP